MKTTILIPQRLYYHLQPFVKQHGGVVWVGEVPPTERIIEFENGIFRTFDIANLDENGELIQEGK